MVKRNKIILTVIVVLLLLTAAGVSFAWFIEGYLSDKFSFAVAFVESKVSLYRAEDNNHDGIPEKDAEGKPLFTFLGDSDKGSVKLDADGNPIIINGVPQYGSDVKVRFEISNIMPTQVFTWKIVIQNVGDVKAKINADINIPLSDAAVKSGIDVFVLSINGKTDIYSGLSYTLDNATGLFAQKILLIDNDPIEYSYKPDEINPYSINEYVFSVKFAKRTDLTAAGVEITDELYNAYMNRVFDNLELSIRLEDDSKY